MNLKVIWFFMFFAFMALIWILWTKKGEERTGFIDYEIELQPSLVQKVTNIKRVTTYLKLSFDSKKDYAVTTKESEDYKPKIFGDFIKVGDSVYKKALNDTLFVSRAGVKYIWLLEDL